MAAIGRLAVHHVGGRNGARVFPICPRFEADIVSVFYDADVDCLPQIKARNADLASELHVLPHCLWSAAERKTLTITRDPYASSLLRFNRQFAERTEFGRDHDYRYGDALRPARTIEVETTTLDHALAQPGAPAAPDFLSIDVQGAELEVLKGAVKTLAQDTVAIQLEIEFVEIYSGQPLFADILRHLEAAGFEFLRFLHPGKAYARPAPIGFRAETCDVSADALFVRRLATSTMNHAQIAKLVFIATIFGHFDLVTACLERLPENWLSDAANSGKGATIARFLAALDQARLANTGFKPWAFPDKWPDDEGRARFGVGAAFDAAADGMRARRKTEAARLSAEIAELRKLGADEPFGYEAVLRAHDFVEQAELLKSRRIAEIGTLLDEILGGRVY